MDLSGGRRDLISTSGRRVWRAGGREENGTKSRARGGARIYEARASPGSFAQKVLDTKKQKRKEVLEHGSSCCDWARMPRLRGHVLPREGGGVEARPWRR